MRISEAIRTYLDPLVGGRVYPLKLPESPTLPAIRYMMVSLPQDLTQSGPTQLQIRQRAQFDLYAGDYDEAEEKGRLMRAALNGTRSTWGTLEVISEHADEGLTEESGLFRYRVDAFLTYKES